MNCIGSLTRMRRLMRAASISLQRNRRQQLSPRQSERQNDCVANRNAKDVLLREQASPRRAMNGNIPAEITEIAISRHETTALNRNRNSVFDLHYQATRHFFDVKVSSSGYLSNGPRNLSKSLERFDQIYRNRVCVDASPGCILQRVDYWPH